MGAEQRTVLIVGASSGIGYELACLYIQAGWRVGVMARRLEPLEALEACAPDRVHSAYIDVCSTEAPALLAKFIEELGGIDLYIHSSGIGYKNASLRLDWEVDTAMVNAWGFTQVIAEVYAYFAMRGRGHIVGISSVAATRGIGLAPAYSASKAYQAYYLQALRQRSRAQGLKELYVTDVRPGFVDTPLLRGQSNPMTMPLDYASQLIYRAINRRKEVAVLDWRFRLLVALWRLLPRQLWESIPLRSS